MGAIMNELVKADLKRPKPLEPLVEFDALSNEAQTVLDTGTRIYELSDGEPGTLEEADGRIAALLVLRPCEQHVSDLTKRLAAARKPATSAQVQEQLVLLAGVFPSSNGPDPRVFAPLLPKDVKAAGPSLIALVAACCRLRRTRKWLPTIADVLEAIGEEEARWQHRSDCASEILGAHAKALEKLDKARAWLARPDEQKKAERLERLDRLERLQQQIKAAAAERSLV
jgi:hypothetical protein